MCLSIYSKFLKRKIFNPIFPPRFGGLINHKPICRPSMQQGFTLVEIIIGMVMTGSALVLISTLIFPLFTRSVEPIFQVRAAEMAQTILDDAISKRYAESTPVGGQPPCSACGAIGPEGSELTRADFDDVDDYNALCSVQSIQDIFGATLASVSDYAGFTFSICVDYDGNYDGVADSDQRAKLITVTVNPPLPAIPVVVSAYRSNY